jgi:hypothetical protein
MTLSHRNFAHSNFASPRIARTLAISCAVLTLGIGQAMAGPCNTQGSQRDAGAGPTVGNTGQAPRSNQASDSAGQHPPNATVGSAATGGPASSEDAQRQMQGQPTAAQQAQGVQPSGQDC